MQVCTNVGCARSCCHVINVVFIIRFFFSKSFAQQMKSKFICLSMYDGWMCRYSSV